jgi:putative FmdB family regulatory protein
MPTYDYRCAKCNHTHEDFRSIPDRDAVHPCPSCGSMDVSREFNAPPMAAVDTNLTPGSDFKEVMNKVSRGVPARYRENLQQAASRRGTVWGTG